MKHCRQVLIAVDQLLNTVVGGWADETLSARCYREAQNGKKKYRVFEKIINAVFFNRAHCAEAFDSEVQRKQYPEAYRGAYEYD